MKASDREMLLKNERNDADVAEYLVKFPHNPILNYVFSSWIEKTMSKTIHCHWENKFVLQ